MLTDDERKVLIEILKLLAVLERRLKALLGQTA
jgi:hypothetical protein